MARTVPSQVRVFISEPFPDLVGEKAEKGQNRIRRGTDVRAVLDLTASIPEELIRLSAGDDVLFWANLSALRNAWEDRNQANNQLYDRGLAGQEHSSLFQLINHLEKCPDEAPSADSTGLEFLPDSKFRNMLRTDMTSANSALINHEYKAAAVLAGSIIEALLLWALEQLDKPEVNKAANSPSLQSWILKPLNGWSLGPMIEAAFVCQLISSNKRKQAELAQNYRNLIHPGRQARLGEVCDRGSAFDALAALKKIAADLKAKLNMEA